MIFRGFFEQIPRELLESARVDGCAERQVLTRIVVPLTRPVLLTGAILVMINVWGDYLWPSIVIQDPTKTTVSAGVQQFVSSFGLNASSGGAVFAAFVIATVPMFVLVGFTMRYFVSGMTEGASKL
jgi:ABC-type glycerol-3-phosphate transport system permease component